MHLMLTLLLAALLTQATPPTKPMPPGTVPQAPATSPQTPATGPPWVAIKPTSTRWMELKDGKIWTSTIRVEIRNGSVRNSGNPLVFPVILDSAASWSVLNNCFTMANISGRFPMTSSFTDVITVGDIAGTYITNQALPMQQSPPPRYSNTATELLVYQVLQTTHCWSTAVDEEAMAKIPWPAQWPTGISAFQKPQPFIESDKPVFANELQILFGGNFRQYSPWIRAKAIVQHCCNKLRIQGSTTLVSSSQAIYALNIKGAHAAASTGDGTENDLVCLSVALLRAAGIPSRPVIGLTEEVKNVYDEDNVFKVWGEFYLPQAGWIPFDPKKMKDSGVQNKKIHDEWDGFGNCRDLNDWIPLAHSFIPSDGSITYSLPALWGWSPLQNCNDPKIASAIKFPSLVNGTTSKNKP